MFPYLLCIADAAGALSKRDKAEVEAEKELKALRAEKAAWLKTQKTLEAQVGMRGFRQASVVWYVLALVVAG